MAERTKEKKASCCEYEYYSLREITYCGRKIDKRYPDREERNYCIFHSHNDDKEEEFYKLINEAIDKTNDEVRKAIDDINKEETDGKTREEKVESVRKEKRLDFEGFYFPRTADFSEKRFEPEMDFSVATFSGEADFRWTTFSGEADFMNATFSGEAGFWRATFSGEAGFWRATFSGEADFRWTTFSGAADFRWATFSEEAGFRWTTFSGAANFVEADFIIKVNFDEATFNKTYLSGMDLRRASFNRASLHLCYIDDIQYSTVTMEGIFIDTFTANTNRIFARDAADYNYIINMKTKCERLKKNSLIFFKDENLTKEGLINRFKWELLRTGMDLWKITSNYGRSFALWFAWSLGIALLFGYFYLSPLKDQLHYARHTTITIEKSVVEGRPVEKLNDKIKPYDDVSWFTPFYYSIVTFTTLGFGDVVPDTWIARAYVALEVFLGYIMLGGLISIFANKLARRA